MPQKPNLEGSPRRLTAQDPTACRCDWSIQRWEEHLRTHLVIDRVAQVVGRSLRKLMDTEDRFEVGGDWMAQS